MENVNHPKHYQGEKYECIDVMRDVFGKDAVDNFCQLNAFKYIWRANNKNGKEDIQKAIWYLDELNKENDMAQDGSVKFTVIGSDYDWDIDELVHEKHKTLRELMFHFYQSFIKAGFDEKQSFKLTEDYFKGLVAKNVDDEED